MRRRARGGARVALLVSSVLLGCGGPGAQPGGALDVVDDYVEAVRAGDAEALWRLLSPETRATTSRAAVAALLEANRVELENQATAIARRVAGAGVPARARWTEGPLGPLVLRSERDEGGAVVWRIEGGVFDAPTLATPGEAVLALRSALARRSLDGMLRVLGRDARADAEAEIAAILAETEDPLTLDVTVEGDRAVVRTTAGRELRLVREAGEWRISTISDAVVPPAPEAPP